MPSRSPATPFTAMGQTFDALQQFWGALGIPTPGSLPGMSMAQPGMLAPTVDLAELDKRIAELRAVEKWLELNASMLRTTIQTLEVQRATIATLKGIGGAMLGPMMDGPAAPARTDPFAFAAAPPAASAPAAAAAPVAEPPAATPARRAPAQRRKAAAPSLAEDALNPAAWWTALQDQFGKIAAAATDAPAEAPAAPAAPRKKARRRKRPA